MKRIFTFVCNVAAVAAAAAVFIAGFLAYFVSSIDPISHQEIDGLGRPLEASPLFMRSVFGQHLWAGWGWWIIDIAWFWGGIAVAFGLVKLGSLSETRPSGGSAMGRWIKISCGACLVIAFVLGVSYLLERPKYMFEQVPAEMRHRMPFARLISSTKTGNLISPVSWFWPPTTVFTFAIPEPIMNDRFTVIRLQYGQDQAHSYLIDTDCKERTIEAWYDLEQPESAIPARDLWGEPVRARNGKTYRLMKVNRTSAPAEWFHAFCNTDWQSERNAMAKPAR